MKRLIAFFRGWKAVAAAAVLAVLAFGALILVGGSAVILRRQETSAWVRRFVKVVPVPAARVNGRTLLYRDLLPRWDAIETFAARAQAPENADTKTPQERRREAYEQAIRELYLQAQADREGFALPEDAVKRNVDQLVAFAGSSTTPGQIDQWLQASFGWSLEEFRDRVVRPATLEEALAQRAAVGGVSVDTWRAQLEDALRSSKVHRYLEFPVSP